MRNRLRTRLLVIAHLLLAPPAFAQQQPDDTEAHQPDIETIIVTGSRAPYLPGELPATVDVITNEQIRRQRPTSLLSVLRHRAGLHIDQAGTRGGRSSVYMRGLDPNHTLVMIDGMPLNDETNARGGSFDFSTLSADDIERVEIIRGPVSAVHGSAAMAGAINLVPRRGRDTTEIEIDASGGRYDYYRGHAALRGSSGPIDLSIGGLYTDEGDPQRLGTYRGGGVLAHGGVALGEQASLRGTVRFSDARSEAFPDFSGGSRRAINREREQRDIQELSAGTRLQHALSDRLRYSVHTSIYRRQEQRVSPAVIDERGDVRVPAEPDTSERYLRYSLQLQGTAEVIDDLEVTLGGSVYREDGRSRGELEDFFIANGADFDIDRIVPSPFAEVHWTTPIGVTLLAGLRVDLPEGRSEEFLPRLGASYTVAWTDTLLQAGWGRGFKLPSFFALARPVVGNRELRPERSSGFDVSVQQPLFDRRLQVRLTYFDIDVSGLIDFDAETFRLLNLADADSRGGELELTATPLSVVELRLHTSYVDATGVSERTALRSRLRNRPRWRGGFGVTWTPLSWVEANVRALFVGDTLDTSAPTGPDPVRLAGYHRLDLMLAWQPVDGVTAFIAVDNLTDNDYEEIIGFPAIGIRPRAGLEIRL